MKPLVIIPARGGSKGVKGKNIKELNGKPLIHYTVEAAREIFMDEQIIVSTDDDEIRKVVESIGLKVPFLRPKELATDTSTSRDVLLHALEWYSKHRTVPDVIILLQPTSPLRKAKHIQEAFALFSMEYDMVVSVKETKSNPYYVLFEEDEEGFLRKSKSSRFTRRQDIPRVWEYNGAIYLINRNSLIGKEIDQFTRVLKYQMNDTNSVDIDTELDFLICESVLKMSQA